MAGGDHDKSRPSNVWAGARRPRLAGHLRVFGEIMEEPVIPMSLQLKLLRRIVRCSKKKAVLRQQQRTATAKQGVCRQCHLDLPHRGRPHPNHRHWTPRL